MNMAVTLNEQFQFQHQMWFLKFEQDSPPKIGFNKNKYIKKIINLKQLVN